MRHIEYISVWSFIFNEINAQDRKIDITDRIVKTGDLVVYVELDFVKTKGESTPGYTGDFCVRGVKQMLSPYPGLKGGFRAILLNAKDEFPEILEHVNEITQHILEMMNKFKENGGYLPLPSAIS